MQSVSGRQIRRIEEHGIIPTPRVMFALASYFEARPSEVWAKALRPLPVAVLKPVTS